MSGKIILEKKYKKISATRIRTGGTTFERFQIWQIPENERFQGFSFSPNPHILSRITHFRSAKSWTILVSKKMSTNCALSR